MDPTTLPDRYHTRYSPCILPMPCNLPRSQPTLWVGSEGANTQCHYDAYGYNLVCQVHGHKRCACACACVPVPVPMTAGLLTRAYRQ